MLQKDGITVAHFDMRFVKPIDEEALHSVFSKYKRVVTVEDGVLQGGFGSAVLEFMTDHQYCAEIKGLAFPTSLLIRVQRKSCIATMASFRSQGILKQLKRLPVKNKYLVYFFRGRCVYLA